MSLEERMLERFTRERQRTAKSAVFNLDDEEELTHYGQSLSKLDDFDDRGLRPDDEDDEVIIFLTLPITLLNFRGAREKKIESGSYG
jgi:nucleolar protein 14